MTEKQESQSLVVVAGGNGFIARHLTQALVDRGHSVVALVRPGREHRAVQHPRVSVLTWDGRSFGPWAQALAGAAAVVNCVGRSVDCVKSPEHQREILESRTDSVRAIGEACRRVAAPPVWLQTGTAHIIGDPEPADTLCDDDTPPPAHGLAPRVGQAWEAEFRRQLLPTQRGVMLRISFVLGSDGGALRRLIPITRGFLGGTVGSGRQWISWIHIDDLTQLWLAAMTDPAYRGVYMATSPNPVTNRDFMAALRRACHRPWSPPAPAFAVRLVSRLVMRTDPELALLGRRIYPARLQRETPFRFHWPELGPALIDVIQPAHRDRGG